MTTSLQDQYSTEAAQLARFKSHVLPIPKIINSSDKQVTCSYKGMLNHQDTESQLRHIHLPVCISPGEVHHNDIRVHFTCSNEHSKTECHDSASGIRLQCMGLGKKEEGEEEREGSLAGQKYCLSLNCHSTTINLLPLMFQLWNVHHRARAKLMNCNIIVIYIWRYTSNGIIH